MARIIHINCPKCGGTLGMGGMERIVDCRFCGTRSLVEAPGTVPEYYVEPSISEVEARRSIQKFLMEDDMPEGLLKYARFHSARLYFVPYYEYYGRRLGTKTSRHYGRERESIRRLTPSFRFYRMEELKPPKKETVDTQVLMMHMIRIEPAIELEEWGLEYSDLESLRKKATGGLQPVTRRALESRGIVFDPTVSVDQMLLKLKTKLFSIWNEENTRITENRVKRIYYPVWRIRYYYQGKLYGATVDGTTGRLLSARAPQDDSMRVLWMLGTSALVSLVFGTILKGLFMAILTAVTTNEEPPVFIFGFHVLTQTWWIFALGALMVLGFGWDQFRYQGEVVIRGNERKVIKIGRPEKTWFDKAREKVSESVKKQWHRQNM